MKVNEIFYSIQGEGHYSGRPAVFVRLSGCNLRCPFCDTQHQSHVDMSIADIVREASQYQARHIVITGGEPTLQLTAELTDSLHEAGFYIQIETNGTCPLPDACHVDWITCSPKDAPIRLQHIDELKVVYQHQDMSPYDDMQASVYSLQPLDTQDEQQNRRIVADTFDYCLAHPKWQLSLQTHKMINVR